MTRTWNKFAFGECATMLSGGTPSKANQAYWVGDIPWVSCKDMKTERIFDTEDHLSVDGTKSGTRLVQRGTVLLVVRGMILAKEFPVAIAMKEVAFNQDLKALRCAAFVDDRFLFYWLKSKTYDILGLADEAAHGTKRLQTDRLQSLEVHVPPLSVQKSIVSVLSAYDNLIENNTRRIKILEQMAQMLYREWFVHFRFPGHEKVKMVESEMGLIPEGWPVGALSDALVLQRGFDLPKDQRRDGRVPIYAATGINGTHDFAKVKAPGVVTGRSGSLGSVNLVLEDFWPLNTALWVKEFKRSSAIHAYFLLKDLKLGGFNSGAAVPTLNRNDVHGLPTVLPPISVLSHFDEHAMPLFRMKGILKRKNSNLRSTRDLLLPKLVFGEVCVDNLEKEAIAQTV